VVATKPEAIPHTSDGPDEPVARRAARVDVRVVRAARPAAQAPRTVPRLSTSAWVESVRRCIVHRESRGNYRAVSRETYHGMHAYGAYQFQDPTWRGVTGLLGHASDYPPAIQDAAFITLFANGKGRSNWNFPHDQCW